MEISQILKQLSIHFETGEKSETGLGFLTWRVRRKNDPFPRSDRDGKRGCTWLRARYEEKEHAPIVDHNFLCRSAVPRCHRSFLPRWFSISLERNDAVIALSISYTPLSTPYQRRKHFARRFYTFLHRSCTQDLFFYFLARLQFA